MYADGSFLTATLSAMSIPIDALYAHTLADCDETEWELLNVHLAAVAEMAERYTSVFATNGWRSVLGQCHDLGKASAEFQANYVQPIHGQHRMPAWKTLL